MVTAFEIMSSENRAKFVLIGFAVWIILSLEGSEGNDIGGDETRFRRRRDYHNRYQDGSGVTTCNCNSQSSRLTCKTPNPDCEPDEEQHDDSCYIFVTQEKNRSESVKDCLEHNSHLVYIETRAEQNFLDTILSGSELLSDQDYWLGLAVNVRYVWMNGDTSVAQELFPVIDEEDDSDCVSLTWDGEIVKLKTDDCSDSKYFICEWGCGEDSCYRFSKWMRTRDVASGICRRRPGGHLLYIETSIELNSINQNDSIEQLDINGDHWIGLNVTRTYQWMDGTPALFLSFEPSNGNDGNECFRLVSERDFDWNDRQCNKQFGHICERRILRSVTQQVITGGDWCQSPIPDDLIRLSRHGALCFDPDDSSSTPVLRSCETHANVEGCSCYKETNGQIQCSCGFCKIKSNRYDEVWPSGFNCSCSSSLDETELFTIVKTDGNAFQCSSDRPPSTTHVSHSTTGMPTSVPTITDAGPLPPSTTRQPISSHGTSPVAVTTSAGAETSPYKNTFTVTSTQPVSSSTTRDKGTAAPVANSGSAVAIGAILACVFFAGLLVVAFFVWRRKGRKRSEKKSERPDKSRAAKNLDASRQLEVDNPEYGLVELDVSKQSDRILKPIHGVGVHAVRNPTYDTGDERETSNDFTYIKSPEDKKKGNTYVDIQPRGYEAYRPNHQPDPYTALRGTKDGNENDDPATYTAILDKAGESYATVAPVGYTAYNSTKPDDDVYTDPLSTRDTDDDDPSVYTPIPNNDRDKPVKKVVDDVDSEYVGLGDVVVPQRHVAAAATTTPSARGRSGDSDYLEVDAKEPRVLKPTVSPRQKKSGGNGNVDAPTTGEGTYVSMDVPTSQGNQGDDNSTEQDDYYFKLKNCNAPPDEDTEARTAPDEDHTYNSLGVNARKVAPSQSNPDDPDNNTYNTVDRTHMRHALPKSAGRSPAQGNIHGKSKVQDDSAYEIINRTGGGVNYPIIGADDGDYSLTVPARDDTYNSFDRSHGRNKKSRPIQDFQNDYGTLENNDDGEYATFD